MSAYSGCSVNGCGVPSAHGACLQGALALTTSAASSSHALQFGLQHHGQPSATPAAATGAATTLLGSPACASRHCSWIYRIVCYRVFRWPGRWLCAGETALTCLSAAPEQVWAPGTRGPGVYMAWCTRSADRGGSEQGAPRGTTRPGCGNAVCRSSEHAPACPPVPCLPSP